MSSLTAWNNFLKEGYEVLGDDFEDLTDYEQVGPAFSKLTEEILPLLTVESGLYQFVNGETLKSWRLEYVEDESKFLGIGLDSEKYILESDAMIMKDERAKYARFLHGFVRDAIQEEAGKFEDTLFEVQEEPEQEDKFREQFYVMLSKIQEKYPKATRRSVLEHCSEKLDIPFNTVASTTSRCNTGKYLRQKAQILEEMESMVQGRKEHKADGLDALQVELSALRDEWYHLTGKTQGLYNEVARLLQCRPTTVSILTSPSTANRRMETKKDAIRVIQKMIASLKGQEKKDTSTETKTMKTQERTTQESINILAKNLAKSVINQLNVNDLNAEIADAFTKVTNLKTELANAEAQLDTYKSVKDMMSKDELTENDILVLTSYVDSMSGN